MTNLVQTNNVAGAGKFRSFFRPRDIFFHDGKQLRRLSVGTGVQVSVALAALLLLVWSLFAAVQLAAPVSKDGDLVRMQREVQTMHAEVTAMKRAAEQRFALTANEIRDLGLDPKRFASPKGMGPDYQGMGGPFEAVEPLKTADPKFKQLFMSWKQLDRIEQGTIAIPSTEPVKGSAFTSGFGVRSDPFRGRAAMHAGVDLAGPLGTPVYATADAIVNRSEWVNGYGNLIELNHGHGIQTRYGHLSKSLVHEGQHVKRGDQIALMGSTGRSTGSHLHYEVRVDGKAVNPIPFLQSGQYLLAVQRRASAATQMAMGGPAEAAK